MTPGADQMIARDPHTVQHDLGVVADPAECHVGIMHRGNVTQDGQTRSALFHHDHRAPQMWRGFWVGDNHEDDEVRDRRVGDHPLAPVEHPLVILERPRRLDLCRIGAGHPRFGDRERTAEVTTQVGPQPAVLLLLGTALGDEFSVARVRSHVPEYLHGQAHPARDEVHLRQRQLTEAVAAHVLRQMHGPQTSLSHLFLERVQQTFGLLR